MLLLFCALFSNLLIIVINIYTFDITLYVNLIFINNLIFNYIINTIYCQILYTHILRIVWFKYDNVYIYHK